MAPRFSRAVSDFESFLAVERNLARGTRREYVADIEQFVAHLAESRGSAPRLDRVVADDVRGYLTILHEKRRLSAARLARIVVSLRQFFDFCLEREYVSISPMANIRTPKKAKKLPIFLISEELRRLFASPDRSNWRGKRDYAILVTLALTGIRLSELVGLDLNDIDFITGQVRVLGKGSKERFVPLNEFAQSTLKEYINERPDTPDSAVFLNKSLSRMSGRSVQNVMTKYGQMAGIFKKGLSPHKLRHTFATLLHMKDVDILEIQSLLGHSSVTSTQIYTHTHPGRLKSAVDKLNDLES